MATSRLGLPSYPTVVGLGPVVVVLNRGRIVIREFCLSILCSLVSKYTFSN
jgi:hypothetical protein